MLSRAPLLRRTFATSSRRYDAPSGRNQPENHNPPPTAYEPPPVTLESLAPLIPATPLSIAGNSAALFHASLRKWARPLPHNLKQWKKFDVVRASTKKGTVEGWYPRPWVLKGKGLVGEVRRLAAKNGSVTERSLRKMVDGIKEREPGYVNPRIAAPKKEDDQAKAVEDKKHKNDDQIMKGSKAPAKKKK